VKLLLARQVLLAGLFLVPFLHGKAAKAQALPSGSYQASCAQVHWAGTTLVAECRRRDGRMTGTGLPDAQRCKADIANNNGQLQCTTGSGARAPAPTPPPEGYGQRREPSYAAPVYGEDRERGRGIGLDEARRFEEQARQRRHFEEERYWRNYRAGLGPRSGDRTYGDRSYHEIGPDEARRFEDQSRRNRRFEEERYWRDYGRGLDEGRR
jgi:hypothetical protein